MADDAEKRLLEQRAHLADFGLLAVEGADLDELLHQAAAEARSLDVSYVKVLQYLPDEKCFLVRAGVGWGEGVVGAARIGADVRSPAGYALQTGRPVISNELHKEERFRIPQLLAEHGVKSAANVIIKAKENIFGVLEVDSREPRTFAADDLKFLQGYATRSPSRSSRLASTSCIPSWRAARAPAAGAAAPGQEQQPEPDQPDPPAAGHRHQRRGAREPAEDREPDPGAQFRQCAVAVGRAGQRRRPRAVPDGDHRQPVPFPERGRD